MQAQVNTQAKMATMILKLQQLSFERINEVEDFIDNILQKSQDQSQDRQFTQAAMLTAESSFQQIWDNPEDADYDNL